MVKNKASEDALGASPTKKTRTENPQDSDDACTDSSAPTPNSTADTDALSVVTGATTPRVKFPSDLKTLVCTWPGCPKSFNRPARLRDHLNSHTNSRPFKCPYDDCDKDYIEDKHLKQHIKASHTHDRQYVCQRDGCGKSFVTGTRLKRHQAVHDGADRFRCQDCGQSFRKRETLNKHVRKDHQNLPAHQCPVMACTRAFDSKGALNRHREREHGDIKFWCQECGLRAMQDGRQNRVGFTTMVLLQAHIKREHQNCLFCEFKSATQGELERHIEMKHSGKTVRDRKTIPCSHDGCTKMFTKRSNLNVHVRTAHQGLRFVCGEHQVTGPDFELWTTDQACGDKFSSKLRLEDHIRYVHLGQMRPARESLMMTHTPGELINDLAGIPNDPSQVALCPTCDESFHRFADLETHQRQKHQHEHPAQFFPNSQVISEDAPPITPWHDDVGDFSAATEAVFGDDAWMPDEANILMLAGAPSLGDMTAVVDPALTVTRT